MRRPRHLWRTLFRRDLVERQMADELAFHIEARATDLMAREQLSRADALRRARIEFGSVEKYKEENRASLGLRLADELRADLRVARRGLIKNIGFSIAAVTILALGIGANTAVFSVVNAMLFYELPVHNPDELVAFDTLQTRDSMVAAYSGNGRPGPGGTSRRTSFSMATFEQFRDHTTTLSHVFAFASLGSVTVVDDESAEMASAQLVSGRYFEGLRVPAVLGRTLGPADDRSQAHPVAVVSHRYWQRRFHGDAAIIGTSVRINRIAVTIVGVTPPSFHGMEITETVDVSLPLAMSDLFSATARPRPLSLWWLLVMGRVQPGVTREQVSTELQPLFADSVLVSWAARPSETRDPWRSSMPVMRVLPGAQGPNGPSPFARRNLMFVFGVTAVVLIIACVNVASLLLVRAANRRHEMSVRGVLGATRARLVRQLLSESLLLATAGTVAGLTLAWWAKDALPRMFEDDVILDTAIDLRALAFAGGLMLVTTVVFGVGHALRATRTRTMPWLKASGAGGQRALVARTLIAVQMTASLVLLVVGGLFVRTVYNFSKVDVGFDTRNMVVFRIDPGTALRDPASAFGLYERVIGALEAVPAVRSATLSVMPVIAKSQWTETVRSDRSETAHDVHVQAVRWNFFATMGMPVTAGRSLQATDVEGAPRVAVINAAMAKQMFAGDSAVGRHFQFANGRDRNIPILVVGVVRDAMYSRLSEPPPPTFFMPYTQAAPQRMTVEVRTAGDALAVVDALRTAVRTVDPDLPITALRTQEDQIAETIRDPRIFATFTGTAGLIGLLLACIGLYGVVSYDAKRRTSEIGLRMALGAQRFDVVRLVMRQTLWILSIGTLLGLVTAGFGSRAIASQLFGVQPFDMLTLASAAALLIVVSCLAVLVPAIRAAHLNPTQALRHES